MVGFDNGFLVIISTHIAEIGREQFCARFHDDCPLRDIAYCPVRHKVRPARTHARTPDGAGVCDCGCGEGCASQLSSSGR